jgi:hypothetical protein
MISGDFKRMQLAGDPSDGPRYRVACTAAANAGRDDRQGIDAAITVQRWIELGLDGPRMELVCGAGGSARRISRDEAERIYRRGREYGIIPVWLFGGWWWMRIILLLVNQWLSYRGSWGQ